MLQKAIFGLVVLAQLYTVAMPNGITHLALGLDVNQYPIEGCNTSSDTKKNRDNEDTSDGSCTGQKENQVTCAVPDVHSRVWIDLGEDTRLRTVIVLERSIPSEVHREKSDSKVIRGCPASVGAGTDGANYDSADCEPCGDQSGLPANQAVTCDMTIQHLFVYLTQDDEILQLNEIMAFEEVTIGHTNDPSGTTATVTVMPEPFEGRAGAQLWRDMMILYANDSESAPYMAMAEPGLTAADTYVTIDFEDGEGATQKVHISKVLVFGNLQNASETPINPNYAVFAYTAISDSNATPAYVQCGADITSTCSERDCDVYATGLKVEKTLDLSQIYVGGIIVFECNITDFSSETPDDETYVQGDDALTITVDYTLAAECTADEYDEEIEYTYTVEKDGTEVSSYPELSFDKNEVTVEIDEEYTDDPLYDEFTYTITVHAEVINSFGTNEWEETFDVDIKDYCYEKGADGTLNSVNTATIVHNIYKPTTDYDQYTGPYGLIDADYPQCYTLTATNDCSDLGTIDFDIADGHVTVNEVTDPTNTGTCTVTLTLTTLDSNEGKGTEMDTTTFDIDYQYNCDITLSFNSYPIDYELSSGAQTTDLGYSIENSYCPAPTGATFDCGDQQTFCDRAVSIVATTGILSIDDTVELAPYDDAPISFTLTYNPGVPNTMDHSGSITFTDPCIDSLANPDTSTAIELTANGAADSTNIMPAWTYATTPAACDVAPTYSLTRQDYTDGEANPLTDYLTFDAATRTITYTGAWPTGETGYDFSITLNYAADFSGWVNTATPAAVTQVINITKPGVQGPNFVTEPDLGSFASGEAYTYTLPNVQNTSGAGATITYTITEGAADPWLIWTLGTTTFSVVAGTKTATEQEVFPITIVLTDDLGFSNTYNKAITVTPAVQNDVVVIDDITDTENLFPDIVFSPNPFEGVVIPEEEPVEEEEPIPIEPEIIPIEEEEVNPVEVSDSNVNNEGVLELDFNKDVVVPEETARLLSEEGHFDLTEYSKITVVGGSVDSAEEVALAIQPVLRSFKSKEFAVELRFRRPLEVSAGSEPDYVVFTLTDNSLFTDAESGRPIDYFEKKLYLPKLVDTNNPEDVKYIEKLEQNGETAGTYFGIIIVLTLVVSLALGTSLKGLWMFIHFAQVVAYLKYYSPNLPANMATIFSLLESTINLSFLGYNGIFGNWDTWANEKFGLVEEAAGVKGLGKDGASISKNVGLYLFAYLTLVIAVALFLILKQVVDRSRGLKPTISKFVSFLQEKLFFSAFLRTMILGCLSFDHLICVLFLLQMRSADENKSGGLVTFVVIFMIIMAAIPPVLGFVLKKYRNSLENKNIKQKFGSLYYGVRTTHTCTIVYTAVFMLRRLVLVLVAVYGQNLRHWLAMSFVIQQVFYLVYLTAVRPQYQPIENFVEIFNEVTTLVFGYFMIFTTDFVPEVSTQYHYGWIISQIIMTVMILNLVYMIFSVVYEGFYQKRHMLKLNELNRKREAKIEQIKKSAEFVKRNNMTDNELRSLMKLKFTKRGDNSSVIADGVKDYTKSATYQKLGLFDERRNQVSQSPTKKGLCSSMEMDDSKTTLAFQNSSRNQLAPQNLTVIYEEEDYQQLQNSFRSGGSDADNISLMFGREEMPSRDEVPDMDIVDSGRWSDKIDAADAKAVNNANVNADRDIEDLDFYPQSNETELVDFKDGTQVHAACISQGSSGNINFNVTDVLESNVPAHAQSAMDFSKMPEQKMNTFQRSASNLIHQNDGRDSTIMERDSILPLKKE